MLLIHIIARHLNLLFPRWNANEFPSFTFLSAHNALNPRCVNKNLPGNKHMTCVCV
jgi:hypothetical protein